MVVIHRRVEHADTDASGVVHFARYPSFLETAALENLHRLGVGLHALAQDGLDLVVTELTMRYAAPARFLDEMSVQIGVAHVGGVRFRLSGTISGNGSPLATGTLSFCVVDKTTGRPHPLPDHLKNILKECGENADN